MDDDNITYYSNTIGLNVSIVSHIILTIPILYTINYDVKPVQKSILISLQHCLSTIKAYRSVIIVIVVGLEIFIL